MIQHILTAEKIRGVASNIIGKDRVYAIGLSFFTSKDKKPEPVQRPRSRGMIKYGGDTHNHYYAQPQFFSPTHTTLDWQIGSNTCSSTSSSSCDSSSSGSFSAQITASACNDAPKGVRKRKSKSAMTKTNKLLHSTQIMLHRQAVRCKNQQR